MPWWVLGLGLAHAQTCYPLHRQYQEEVDEEEHIHHSFHLEGEVLGEHLLHLKDKDISWLLLENAWYLEVTSIHISERPLKIDNVMFCTYKAKTILGKDQRLSFLCFLTFWKPFTKSWVNPNRTQQHPSRLSYLYQVCQKQCHGLDKYPHRQTALDIEVRRSPLYKCPWSSRVVILCVC